MPDSSYSDALKEAYATNPVGSVQYHTLELRHPDFTAPIYVVNDDSDLTATLETGETVTFVRFSFQLVLPEVDAQALPQMTLQLDNVTREMITHIRQAMLSSHKITVLHRIYDADDLSGPQNDPPQEADILTISADVFRVRCQAGYATMMNRSFPPDTYDLQRWPGLYTA